MTRPRFAPSGLGIVLIVAQVAAVGLFSIGLRGGQIPLGVPGEWEWLRIAPARSKIDLPSLTLAFAAIVAYASLVTWGRNRLGESTRLRRLTWVATLVASGAGLQLVVQEAAPEGYGLAKWVLVLQSPGSSGYYQVARREMADPAQFLRDFPRWIVHQDALHVGTHPPGLFLLSRGMLGLFGAHPGLTRAAEAMSPGSLSAAIRAMRGEAGISPADASALAATGGLTWLCCVLTVIPLYMLVRATSGARMAWTSASLWPVVPAALMFQPDADAGLPLLSTSACALASWSAVTASRSRSICFAALGGAILGLGMQFTLLFLAIGLIVAIILVGQPGPSTWRRRVESVIATGFGFLAVTLLAWWISSANPFAIWWANQRNHGRFYDQFPRSYLAWWIVNPIEAAVAIGLPAALAILVGLVARRRNISAATWATLAVLAVLTISGRNLSEVARLWLPMMPMLLAATGEGADEDRAAEISTPVMLVLTGVQVLVLQATVQVVYPI